MSDVGEIRYLTTDWPQGLSEDQFNVFIGNVIASAEVLPADGMLCHSDSATYWFVSTVELSFSQGQKPMEVCHREFNQWHLHYFWIPSDLPSTSIQMFSNTRRIASVICVNMLNDVAQYDFDTITASPPNTGPASAMGVATFDPNPLPVATGNPTIVPYGTSSNTNQPINKRKAEPTAHHEESENKRQKKTGSEIILNLPMTEAMEAHVRYMNAGKLGSRLTGTKRYKKIFKKAKQLTKGKQLKGRRIYWFVTTSEVELIFDDEQVRWGGQKIIDNNKRFFYLNQVEFLTADGSLDIKFANDRIIEAQWGTKQSTECSSSNPNASPDKMELDEESRSQTQRTRKSNTNIKKRSQVPPQTLSNGQQVPSNEPLIVNIILLVPDNEEYIQMAKAALIANEFTEEICSTVNQQYLYSQIDSVTKNKHVLLFPYGKFGRFRRVEDYVGVSSEVILLIENEGEQEAPLMAIGRITNINDEPENNWPFKKKVASFKTIELNHATLSESVKTLLLINDLRDAYLGGACGKKQQPDGNQLTELFKTYLLQWLVGRVEKRFVPNIYLCFKFEPQLVQAFTEYASKVLVALKITHSFNGQQINPTPTNGSVLVYVRCPSYMPWYILQRQEEIFNSLKEDGLKEIYECFISDVEASMQRPDNKEFVDELLFLQQQMISDGVAFDEAGTKKRFRVSSGADIMDIDDAFIDCPATIEQLSVDKQQELKAKWTELKKFDNKLTKTLEDCYNKDKLLQQLFTFKQEKNVKIAVRVFISSASAGLATNVAKLMRKFNGKSIVDGVHSGLQIANTIVEWNQSGIVHIGELKHANAVAVLFDVQDSVKFDFTDDVAQKMVSFIQKWNTEHRYSSDEFNSHRFVRDFLQYTMNIPLIDRFQGPLGYYMDHVMRTGDATPRLFSKNNGVMVFKTHEELEETERAIKSKLSEDELKLMKIFHRGFQLQEAANDKDVSSCSYGLPTNGLEILNDSGKPMKY